MATVSNGKATSVCPYCRKRFEPYRKTQVTCGSEACKRANVNYLSSGPERRKLGPGAPPVGRQKKSSTPQGPPEAGDFSCHGASPPGTSDEFAPGHGGLSRSQPGPLGDGAPILVGTPDNPGTPVVAIPPDCLVRTAVEAIEALPQDKWQLLITIAQVRYEARQAQATADRLIQELLA